MTKLFSSVASTRFTSWDEALSTRPARHGAHPVDEWVSLKGLRGVYRVLEPFGKEGWE